MPNELNSLKSKVDKLDVDKQKAVPVDLKKLSNTVENEVVKKTVFDELVKRVNVIKTADAIDLVQKLIVTQKLMKSKRNRSLLKNLIC